MIFSGNNKISKVYSGQTAVKSIWSGNTLVWQAEQPDEVFYLTRATNTTGNSFQLGKSGNPAAVDLVYSTDDLQTWNTLSVGTTYALPAYGTKMYIKSNGSTTFSTEYNAVYRFNIGQPTAVGGNIQYLIDPTGKRSDVPAHAFRSLFSSNQQLLDSSNLRLPALSVYYASYYGLFGGCNNMSATVSDLPADYVQSHGYNAMFLNCSSLKASPEMSIKTVGQGTCTNMFNGCNSMKTGPSRLADNVAVSCYTNMFLNCYSMVNAPELPVSGATAIVPQYAYMNMFKDCRSLSSAPDLNAGTALAYAYNGMFVRCYNLSAAPAIATKIAMNNAMQYMFTECSSLAEAPEMEIGSSFSYSYGDMFRGCAKLSSAEKVRVFYDIAGQNQYQSMFKNCTSLKKTPDIGMLKTFNKNALCGMFEGCTSLEKPAELTSVVNAFPNNTTGQFSWMYANCSALTAGMDLSVTYTSPYLFLGTYLNCYGLEYAPYIPVLSSDYILNGAYGAMFNKCSNLLSVKFDGSRGNANGYLFSWAFNGCTKLSCVDVKLSSWVSNATSMWLNNVAATGEFHCPQALIDATTTRGANTVPAGWTMIANDVA